MSQNGEKSKYYEGWHQTDVLRVKALDRLQQLMADQDHAPFFLMIAPTAPHVENATGPPTPPSRYNDRFSNLSLHYRPNFNPPDDLHQERPSWWSGLPFLNATQVGVIEELYRHRSKALLGVDDIITDVVDLLESRGELNNTYIVYSTDQDYHLGTHRDVRKCSPYIEDANTPLVVRGPGIPAGEVSTLPSTVTDFAPTFLDIIGLADEERPSFLDGTSMLPGWNSPPDISIGKAKEAINVEFWGRAFTEISTWEGGDGVNGLYRNNTYKTMRVVAEDYAWVYTRWCTGDTELYDSKNDPYELKTLAGSEDADIQRVQSRLNALLMTLVETRGVYCNLHKTVSTKQAGYKSHEAFRPVDCLASSLDPAFDESFSNISLVNIAECYQYQYAPNKEPFYPPEATSGLGLAHRNEPVFFEYPDVKPVNTVRYKVGGGWEQRNASLETLMLDARDLTTSELTQAEYHNL